MPEQVVLARVIPIGVEATVFALLIGVKNLTESVMPSMIGAKINDLFIGLTKQTQEAESKLTGWDRDHSYIKLNVIGTVLGFLSIVLIWVVPTRAQLDQFQKEQMQERAKEKDEGDLAPAQVTEHQDGPEVP